MGDLTGTKDGQTKIIREGNSGVAYTWDKKEYKWEKVAFICTFRPATTFLGLSCDIALNVFRNVLQKLVPKRI